MVSIRFFSVLSSLATLKIMGDRIVRPAVTLSVILLFGWGTFIALCVLLAESPTHFCGFNLRSFLVQICLVQQCRSVTHVKENGKHPQLPISCRLIERGALQEVHMTH